MIFAPWVSTREEVTLNTPEAFLGDTYYTEHSEWKMVGNGTRINKHNMIFLEFEVERKPLFAMVNTIVPMMIMSVLNLMVFVLPAESGERVSFTITVLLASAVFLTLVANSLPASSDPMSILAFFLMVVLLLSALICITTILNLRVYHKSSCEPISALQRRLVRMCCKGKTKRGEAYQADKTSSQDTLPTTDDEEDEISWQNVASAIDKILFIGFSAAFVLNSICFTILSSVNKGVQRVETIGD